MSLGRRYPLDDTLGLNLTVARATRLAAANNRAAESRPVTVTQSINNIIVLHLATTAFFPIREVLITTGISVSNCP